MERLLCLFHAIFWSTFLLRLRRRREPDAAREARPSSGAVHTTRRAWPALLVHAIGFGTMYAGIDRVAFSSADVSRLFCFPPEFGASVILLGAVILGWALSVFESWRILARLEEDHRLCTRGPYRYVRNPIYLACDLLAIGTFLLIATWATLAGVVFMHLGGELRARTEEKLLAEAFGEDYRRYRERTGRFLPRIA